MSDERTLEEVRPAVFAVAYRMLGTVSEAEEVVQESLLRLHQALAEGERIASPRAYAVTVATRLAIDELRSARARREVYVGEWMPEPLLEDPGSGPAAQAELADSLSLAFLLVLERLTPEQRGAFLLHDVFDYDYPELARILGVREDNARQLASRARRLVREQRPRFDTSSEQHEALADRFFAAVQDGNLEGLEALLAGEVELHADGGGKVPAIARPLVGRARVARALATWSRLGERIGGLRIERVEVNGQPGARALDPNGELISVLALEIAGGEVRALRSIVNPEKLGHLGPVADVRAMLRGVSGS